MGHNAGIDAVVVRLREEAAQSQAALASPGKRMSSASSITVA